MTPRTSRDCEKKTVTSQSVSAPPTRAGYQKKSLPGGSGEVFLLDIPFYRTRGQAAKGKTS
jgi:hypothetical protein